MESGKVVMSDESVLRACVGFTPRAGVLGSCATREHEYILVYILVVSRLLQFYLVVTN